MSSLRGELKIDSPFNRMHRRDDNPQPRPGPQSPTRVRADPFPAASGHLIVIIPECGEWQQAVCAHIQQLHETAELQHAGDQPIEGLTDAITQIHALEEGADKSVGLIGAALEP